jgi:glyoxylase-like metal-dependent hydrolase (beta-lactamase superfamily II)
MARQHRHGHRQSVDRRVATAIILGMAVLSALAIASQAAFGQPPGAGAAREGQSHEMAAVAPIGVPIERYLPIPPQATGAPIDPAKGYRLQQLGRGLFMVTDNAYQSLFLVHDHGVIVVDAPPAYAARLRRAIAEVTALPVTHIVYSHSHADHIAGTAELGGNPIIVAHEETKRLLERAGDRRRPPPTVTFSDRHVLSVGGQRLELSYRGVGHEPGNIFIYAPEQQVLMVVDVVFPGWMPWRRFALAEDLSGYFDQVEAIAAHPFETFVGGHVSRTGNRADVLLQLDFMKDVKDAAAEALRGTAPGSGLHPADRSNPWAVFDSFIDRVAGQCVASVTRRWRSRLAGFDAFIWDQCYAMEQSLRID